MVDERERRARPSRLGGAGLDWPDGGLALLFGFSSLFYFAILLVPVVFVMLLQLCAGKLEA